MYELCKSYLAIIYQTKTISVKQLDYSVTVIILVVFIITFNSYMTKHFGKSFYFLLSHF